MILGVADASQNRLWCDEALVNLQILRYCFHHLKLVGFVVNRKVSCIVQRFDFAAEQANAERMKCRNQRITRTRRTKKIANAKLHLIGGFIGECNCEDLLRPDVAIFNQVRHAIGDDPGLAAACAGENEDRALATFHGVELFGIEKLRKVHAFYEPQKGLIRGQTPIFMGCRTSRSDPELIPPCGYSTVTLFARLRGWSISQPRRTAQ